MKITHDALVSFLVWTAVFVVGVWVSNLIFRLASSGLLESYRLLHR